MVKISTLIHQPLSMPIRNPNVDHPFAQPRQYQRALNAVKLQKIFARPFLASLSGHTDGITCMAKCTQSINKLVSGSHNGEIISWSIGEEKLLKQSWGHEGQVKGLSFNRSGQFFVSSSNDNSILLNQWDNFLEGNQAKGKYISKSVILDVDHSAQNNQFITSGSLIQIWNYQRNKPYQIIDYNVDSILKVKYNPSEFNILAATGIDNSIFIYDIRSETMLDKIYIANKAECISWNPRKPLFFTVGSNDSNIYTFDIRNMGRARTIHKGHIQPVMSVDYSPTGKEFASGSYDKSIRIFQQHDGTSRQVYHAKRMQQVNSVLFTMDGDTLLSASQDMNIRKWKAFASNPVGEVNQRQKRALQYRQKLLQKYKYNRKIRRIAKHRHLPKYIVNAAKRRQQHVQSQFRKKQNIQINNNIVYKQKAKQKVVQKKQT